MKSKLLAFERYTDKVEDTIIVVVNPSDHAVSESVLMTNSSLMNWTVMQDLAGNAAETIFVKSSMLHLDVAARSFLVLKPNVTAKGGYTPYKRVP